MFVWLVYLYRSKYRWDGWVWEGHYEQPPKVFRNKKDAYIYGKSKRKVFYVLKVKLR